MDIKENRNKNIAKKGKGKTGSGKDIVKSKIEELINDEVENFLTSGERNAVIKNIFQILKQPGCSGDIKEIIKKTIHHKLMKHYSELEKINIDFPQVAEDVIANFSIEDFLNKSWKYIPYVLKEHEFMRLLSTEKSPIFINNYNYAQPIYSFTNSYKFNSSNKRNKTAEVNYNDIQYYLSKGGTSIYSKIIEVKYQPISMKLVKEKKKELGEDDKDKVLYDGYSYDRNLAVSMYVFLDGDSKKAFPYFRYDSASATHNNFYVGNDKRKDVFGLVAQNPHFHFQNEDDNLLCLKKFTLNRKVKYRTGRCNAIDIPHLKKYLQDLDNTSLTTLKKQHSEGKNYGMPFLEYKVLNKPIILKFNNIIRTFDANFNSEEKEIFKRIIDKFNSQYPKEEQDQNQNFFTNLIKSLDFIQFLYDNIHSNSSINDLKALKEKEMMSNLEVSFVSNIVDGICKNSEVFEKENFQPRYSIDAPYLMQDDENGENNGNCIRIKGNVEASFKNYDEDFEEKENREDN